MLSAIGGETTVFFRPVEPAAPVGPRGVEPRATPGVSDAEGGSLSGPPPQPLESLTAEKQRLLAALRGEHGAGGGAEPRAGALTPEEERVVDELKARDREVRAHEQAHALVGGPHAGSPRYEYQLGPDGRNYAIGGSVSIDVSPVPGDPQATVEKMRVVERAALAPAEPSTQDYRVAQTARALALEAEIEAARLAREEAQAERDAASGAAVPDQAAQERGGLSAVAAKGYEAGAAAGAPPPPPSVSLAA
ncbi:MAG: putative metalloprotease CJM1_0395 family protein [Pseudomonadota bacterium]